MWITQSCDSGLGLRPLYGGCGGTSEPVAWLNVDVLLISSNSGLINSDSEALCKLTELSGVSAYDSLAA